MFFKLEVSKMEMTPEVYGRKRLLGISRGLSKYLEESH